MMTIYLLNGKNISFSEATKKDFDMLKDFMGNDDKKNYIIVANNGATIIPKDKILFVSYKEGE